MMKIIDDYEDIFTNSTDLNKMFYLMGEGSVPLWDNFNIY
jgi:hypothetical protein